MVELNKIYCEDCLEFMSKIPDDQIDCIITSPPYMFKKEYTDYDDKFNPNDYISFLGKVFGECARILKSGGRIFVNVQPVYTDRFPTHHIISQLLANRFLTWGGEIIWDKNNFNCPVTAWGSWKSPSQPYLKSTCEYIEYYFKDSPKHIGKPEDIDITGDEFKKWVNTKWNITPETRMKDYGHPAMFPEELVERILKLFTYKNDLVYDPFNGAGTTCAVCERLDRKYLGTDISEEYCKTANKRCSDEKYLKENSLW